MCLDLETTGLDSSKCEITEIGASFFKLETLYKGEFGELVKTKKPIPKKITEITGIDDEMVKNCNSIDVVLGNLVNNIKYHLEMSESSDLVILCQNAKFDISFLTQAMLETGVLIKYSMVLDTRIISKHIFPDEKKHALDVLCDRFNVVYDKDSHHRAVYDTQITRDVFINQIENNLLSFRLDKTIVFSNHLDKTQKDYLQLMVNEKYKGKRFEVIVNSLNYNTIIEYLTLL